MALINFGYRVDMNSINPPTNTGSYVVAYDLDGILKQKDHFGNINSIGSGLSSLFYNIGGTVSSDNSTSAIYRIGSLNIGTGIAADGRFVVSSLGGTVSLSVSERGNVIIGSTQSINSKLFINSATSSTTIGSNVMLDLYNSSDDGVSNMLSELGFSAKGQPFSSDPYNSGHRFAIISGYVNQFNNLTSGGGLIFSTRETTSSSLTERLRITHDGRVGIGVNPVTTAILQVDSTTKGFLPPRMTNTQRTSITSPEVGLIVYCTDATEGLYVYKSTGWQFIV